jgi:hypothetical protein
VIASSEASTLLVFESADLSEPKEVANHDSGVHDLTLSATVLLFHLFSIDFVSFVLSSCKGHLLLNFIRRIFALGVLRACYSAL